MDSTIANPKRVAAGKRNRALRGRLSAESRQRLRDLAIRNQPWTFSTGPCTVAGKVRVADNGRTRQTGAISKRQMRADLVAARKLVRDIQRFLAERR